MPNIIRKLVYKWKVWRRMRAHKKFHDCICEMLRANRVSFQDANDALVQSNSDYEHQLTQLKERYHA